MANSKSRGIEIDNCYTTGGWLFSCDLHVAAGGDVHMLWHENPIHPGLRNERFPDIKRIWALKYAVVRRGEVILRRSNWTPRMVSTTGGLS